MNKILITIQGRTLILYYLLKYGLAHKDSGLTRYIEVLSSPELDRYNLKGLTPEMFCVNISDMVNIRGMYSGQVENEKQIPVAKWEMNYEEYLLAKNTPATNLTHLQIVHLLSSLPDYIQETNNQYIDFEESLIPHGDGVHSTSSGYRLTIMTEEIDGNVSSYAYYSLDTRTSQGWQGYPPPPSEHESIKAALTSKLQAISLAGVNITQVYDETDYAIVS